MQGERYDYIICGAGCAGLSLAYYLTSYNLEGKKVLLIDQDSKTKNDRTWCFWQKGESSFENIVQKQWKNILFNHPEYSSKIDISPYRYKKIKGIDFYKKVLGVIHDHPNIDWHQESILSINEDQKEVSVICQNKVFKAPICFNSITDKVASNDHHVLQHFKGWFVESEKESFDVDSATFMDFCTDQKEDLRFLYVLPTSPKKALIEVAIFSNTVLESSDYDIILERYINEQVSIEKYSIEETEMGVIPMTTYAFEKNNTKRIKNIGTAGGWVKATTGFAFDRIQRYSAELALAIAEGKDIDKVLKKVNNRFRFYDKIFLNVLLNHRASGSDVFISLFEKLPAQLVFKFLDEETSVWEDLQLFTAPPFAPFLKALKDEII